MENGIQWLGGIWRNLNVLTAATTSAEIDKAAEGTETKVDFFVHDVIVLVRNGDGTPKVSITTTHVCLLLVMAVLIGFAFVANRKIKKAKKIPDGLQNVVELLSESLDGIVKSSMHRHAPKFRNYMSTIFCFIFVANISGLFMLRPPTADYGVTLTLGLITFVMIQYSAIKTSKFGYLKDLTSPVVLTPINVIGEVATPISLSVRLFGNIMSGTVMMTLYYSLLPIFFKIGIPSFLHIYFDLMSGAIQAFVFTMLTMTFVTSKLDG